MLRVTTLHASSAAATAAYYAQYLTAAPGEVPGVWSGRQAAGLGLSGAVDAATLELLLSGRDPASGTPLGRELVDRFTNDGRRVRAVSGFDATFSAPKSLSVWWALTGDSRLLEAHDIAVTAALEHLERFGSTTRIRCNGGRLHPDTNGLTIARFRQTTSRADDPQIHTHAVISAKVQTAEGRWLALDARYLKRHQRVLGGLYQSVLRAELTDRLGVEWAPIVNGQAEIAGVPNELIALFSKRSGDIDLALNVKVDEFRDREGRYPSRWERAALTREASADTRSRKSGHGVTDLATRWQAEAAEADWSIDRLEEVIHQAAINRVSAGTLTVGEIVETVSAMRSSWGRADVLQAICDRQRPVSQISGRRWAEVLERSADRVLDQLVDLDPADESSRRVSDGRSLWIEPTAPRYTSETVLTQEERILSWAMEAQADPPSPSITINRDGLDVFQADATAAVAGHDALVLVVGPAGAGKTRMLTAAAADLHRQGRRVFGVAPTAKAARVLERDTGMRADTVAKLLHEWHRPDRPPAGRYRLAVGATVIVDEAGMLATPTLDQLVTLAEAQRWRVVLVGDPRQLQGVGRGGLLAELCANGRVEQLEQLHRFTHRWEADASLLLRAGDPRAFDAYEAHGRIIPGTLDEHLARIADTWITNHQDGRAVAVVASTNDHVDTINHAVQHARLTAGQLDPDTATAVAAGESAYIGDVIATRRNDRRLLTSTGDTVRNRETWMVTGIGGDGSLTVTHREGHGVVVLPAEYVGEHVRLGYAATEHGWESDTVGASISLASSATTRRGLYVAVTRGREENQICVITDSDDVAEARDILDGIVALDRADVPAVTQRRTLAHQQRHQPSTPAPTRRCTVPDWFGPLLADARAELARRQQTSIDLAVERRRLEHAVTAADQTVRKIDAATRPDRHALDADERAADQARLALHAAQRRLESSTLRTRRSARRDVRDAEVQLQLATGDLAETRMRTASNVGRFTRAVAAHADAHDHLRHHRLSNQLHAVSGGVEPAQRRVDALETWQLWATGQNISPRDIHDTIDHLIDRRTWTRTPERVLGEAINAWATRSGIQPTDGPANRPAPRHAGIELGF